MKETSTSIIYDADDEEPNCIRCDNCVGGFKCEEMCGPRHGWYGYRRTEYSDEYIKLLYGD